jgi:uncharacterized membrane protein (DUF106 family)
MFGVINSIVGAVFDVLFVPFRALPSSAAMTFISLLTGLLMLFIFKKTSNQAGILRAKNLIKAHLLELRLYKNDFGQTMRSQGRILLANGRYLGHALKPMLVMFIPILIILFQLEAWFGVRPLRAGETAIVKVILETSRHPLQTPVTLTAPAGVAVETLPLRIEEGSEIDWRVRAVSPGFHELTIDLPGETITKTLAVGQPALAKLGPRRVRRGLDELSNPAEKAIPRTSPIISVEVTYPSSRLNFFGWRMHWLVAFFLLSVVFGFALKGVFKVEI